MDTSEDSKKLDRETEETLTWGVMRRIAHGLPVIHMHPVQYEFGERFLNAVRKMREKQKRGDRW